LNVYRCLDIVFLNVYRCLDTVCLNGYRCLDTVCLNVYRCLDTVCLNIIQMSGHCLYERLQMSGHCLFERLQMSGHCLFERLHMSGHCLFERLQMSGHCLNVIQIQVWVCFSHSALQMCRPVHPPVDLQASPPTNRPAGQSTHQYTHSLSMITDALTVQLMLCHCVTVSLCFVVLKCLKGHRAFMFVVLCCLADGKGNVTVPLDRR
jgi:hypothetical protein